MTEENQAATGQQAGTEKRLTIAKIYTKDLSFESPQAPTVFQSGEWKPETSLNLRSGHTALENNLHEVVLTITAEAKEADNTVFLVELHQAGLFEIVGSSGDELGVIVGSVCPNLLFPYAREAIASTVQRGGFPEFVLQPINFDAIYAQSLQQRAETAQAAAPEEKH